MPKAVDAAERRAEFTGAAARLIARSGVESATMRDVAAEAGFTTGAVTHYFADKHELLLATFHESLARRRARRPSSADAAPAERLRASLVGALPLDDDRRRHWLVTLSCAARAESDPELATAQRDAYREFRRHVARMVDAAGLAPAGEARLVAERLISAADGIAIQALFDPQSWPPARQLAGLDAMMAVLTMSPSSDV